jgi:hypothetical protein
MTLTCKTCKEEKPPSDFCRDNASRRGFRYTCKACDVIANRRWCRANPERAKKHSQAYAKKHPEIKRAQEKRWRDAHPPFYAEKRMRAYAKSLNAVPTWSERNKILVVYQKAAELGLWVDHIVPLRSKLVCGLHVWANVQLLSSHENKTKYNVHWPDMPC